MINPNHLRKKDLYKYNTIILVRYIPFKLILDLSKLKREFKKVILLIDDNLLDFNIFSELPFLYKMKIFFNVYCYKLFLGILINEIWVTNKMLGKQVKKNISNKVINIKILDLSYRKINTSKEVYKVAYLGTTSHTLEMRWLKPLFEKIQLEREDCLLEIYVDKKWRNYFRSIPRLKMIHPMDWETFYLDSLTRKVDIVLNPIMNSKFNKYRSPTKFFDTTRLGAIGIYSDKEPFSNFIKDNHDGILLDNNINLWIKKINNLLENKNERRRIYINAQKKLDK